MRLEPLCKLTMRYVRGSWHRPYGRAGGQGEEGLGFGHGDGEVAGEVEGTMVWANYPRRREDGVWTPNLHGAITTPEGEEILVAIHGQSIEENAPGRQRAILARVELTTESESYRWPTRASWWPRARSTRSGRSGGYPPTCASTRRHTAHRQSARNPLSDSVRGSGSTVSGHAPAPRAAYASRADG
jgi:hypothetical protein